MSNSDILPSEVLYCFLAWLVGRDEQIILSAKDSADPAYELFWVFCRENGWAPPRDHIPEYVRYPIEVEPMLNATLPESALDKLIEGATVKMLNVNDQLAHMQFIRATAEQACAEAFEHRNDIDGAINWGDLHCAEVGCVIREDGQIYYRVVIEEAAAGSSELIAFIQTEFTKHNFERIEVETEW